MRSYSAVEYSAIGTRRKIEHAAEFSREVVFSHRSGADRLAIYLQDKIIRVNLDRHVIGGETLDEGELTSIALYKYLQSDYLFIDEKAGCRIVKISLTAVGE